MNKVNIIVNCKADKFINIIKNSKDLVIKKNKKNYVITAFVCGDDMQETLNRIDASQGMNKSEKIINSIGSTFGETERSHCTMFPFKFNIEEKDDKCIIIGKFYFGKLLKLILFFLNILFLSAAIAFLLTILVPILIVSFVIFFDIMIMNEEKLYMKVVLKMIENELYKYNINIEM